MAMQTRAPIDLTAAYAVLVEADDLADYQTALDDLTADVRPVPTAAATQAVTP